MIGVFDSGVGGLSILKEIRALLPEQSYIYVADQAHVPYGPRPLTQIRKFTSAICQYLIQCGAQLVVIACNTASGAALQTVREQFPEIPFVGLVPAIKPAAERTMTGKIAVLATPGAFHGKLYITVKNQYAQNVIVFQDTVPGLVEQIEQGHLDHPETTKILETALNPLLKKNIDKIVLGCTHYPFVTETIRKIAGGEIELIDPAPAIARRIQYLLDEYQINQPTVHGKGKVETYISTAPEETLSHALRNLLGMDDFRVDYVPWNHNGTLTCKES